MRYLAVWTGAAAVFGLLMSVGGYTAIARAVTDSIASLRYPPEVHAQAVDMLMQQKVGPNRSQAIAGVWRSFFFVALTAGVLWAFLTNRIPARTVAYALAALLVVDLWTIERRYWIFSPRASVIFASDPAIDAIKADIAKTGQPARVLNRALSNNVALELSRPDRTFTGDKLMVHGIRIPGGYHGNELGMYQRLMDLDSGSVDTNPRFWRHENVQYWYSELDDSTMAQVAAQLRLPRFIHLAGPVKNASGSTVHAYKVASDNPAAWVTNAMVKAPPDQALATVLNPLFNPATVAIVDTSAKDVAAAAQIQSLPPPATTQASVPLYAAGSIDVTLDQPAAAGQALIVAENFYPGWRATVDGKSTSVARMNYNLIGVPLPAGARSIQLRFVDAAYQRGKVVTLVALLIAALMTIGGVVMERRRPGPISATA
jgi:hypothetical protein